MHTVRLTREYTHEILGLHKLCHAAIGARHLGDFELAVVVLVDALLGTCFGNLQDRIGLGRNAQRHIYHENKLEVVIS